VSFQPGEAAVLPPDVVEVGRVVGAWGVRGGIKVKPFSADPQALFSTKRWYLDALPDAPPRPPGAPAVAYPRLLRVAQAREQGDLVVATIDELTDRDHAQALTGSRVLVSRSSFPTPGEGEFYWVDLIGLQVVDREQRELGRVVGLIETGPHSVLRIQPAQADADEILIPFVDAYVDGVDLPGRRIRVDWGADYQ
jgi:16S rRNA processing protein RimM